MTAVGLNNAYILTPGCWLGGVAVPIKQRQPRAIKGKYCCFSAHKIRFVVYWYTFILIYQSFCLDIINSSLAQINRNGDFILFIFQNRNIINR